LDNLNRRSFLKIGAFAALAGRSVLSAEAAPAATSLAALNERSLSFYNLHTSESLKTVYWHKGEYIPESLADVNRVLRDHRTGDQHEMDRRLLDLLCDLRLRLDTSEPFQVISGYRSPATNAMLHEKSEGVASHSLHMDGMAIDIRVSGRRLASLRDTALTMKSGGVGYYPASDFVHVDVGRIRRW
jgi:uncharacterized protein YcbK (DUF882 family)